MVMEYWITGGFILMSKADFAKEMLRKDSILRKLLEGNTGGAPFSRHPAIKHKEDGLTIDFKSVPEFRLEDDPKELMNSLKLRYGDRIHGKVSVKSIYTTFNQLYYFEVDIN